MPEHYTETIEEVLSSAKSPRKDGKGYLYPIRGKVPFDGMFLTNGRQAIRVLVSNLCYTELKYR